MKYAHLADLHLGSWRDEKMRDLSTQAFLKAIDQFIEQKIDFILFAGDLFNTSLPSLDILKVVTSKLKELKDQQIPLYVIAGSHDFSPSGKTMIDVLENAGLLKNVCKGKIDPQTKQLQLNFTIDQKTGAKITGILGKKGLLDKSYYQNLTLEPLEQESGYKIFMFHTTLTELKPKHLQMMESQPLSFLPKGFDYYAGGHVHHPTKLDISEYGTLTYPGALFPNNFAELEKYENGGYYLVEVYERIKDQENNKNNEDHKDKTDKTQKIEWVPLEIIKHKSINLICKHKTPEQINIELLTMISEEDFKDSLVTIRLSGELEQGRLSEINFKLIFEQLYQQGAYFVMKNTAQLHSKEFEEIKISECSPENVEEQIIKEHLQQIKLFDQETELHLTKSMLSALNTTKKEGETITDFQKRIEEETSRLLDL